ncbi:MAG: hypothetical protein Q9157_006317 [Trypethelium eluteriae]
MKKSKKICNRLKMWTGHQQEVTSPVIGLGSALGTDGRASEGISSAEERSGNLERGADISSKSKDQSEQKRSSISRSEINDHSQLKLQGNANGAISSDSREDDGSDSEGSVKDDASEEAIFKFLEAEHCEKSVIARDAFGIDLNTIPRDYGLLVMIHCRLIFALTHIRGLIDCKYPTRHKKRGYTRNDHNLKTRRKRKCSLLRSEVKAEDVIIPKTHQSPKSTNLLANQMNHIPVDPTFTEIPLDVHKSEQSELMRNQSVHPANVSAFNEENDDFADKSLSAEDTGALSPIDHEPLKEIQLNSSYSV